MRLVSIRDVADVRGGYWGQGEPTATSTSPVQVVRNGDLTREGELTGSVHRFFTPSEAEKSALRKGDILITSSGDIGKVHIVAVEGLHASNFVKRIRVDASIINPRYLWHVLRSPAATPVMNDFTSGSTISNLKAAFFEKAWVPLPPLEEQTRTVAKLDEELLNIQHLRTLLETRKSLLASYSGTWLRSLIQASNWPTRSLGDICRIRTGKKDVNQGNPNGRYPFFTCAKEHSWSDDFSFDAEAILVAGNGNVGQSTYYKGKFEAYQRTYVLTDFDSLRADFAFQIIASNLVDHLRRSVMGNTIPYIKLGMLQDFQMPVPSIDEQAAVAQKAKEIDLLVGRASEFSPDICGTLEKSAITHLIRGAAQS